MSASREEMFLRSHTTSLGPDVKSCVLPRDFWPCIIWFEPAVFFDMNAKDMEMEERRRFCR